MLKYLACVTCVLVSKERLQIPRQVGFVVPFKLGCSKVVLNPYLTQGTGPLGFSIGILENRIGQASISNSPGRSQGSGDHLARRRGLARAPRGLLVELPESTWAARGVFGWKLPSGWCERGTKRNPPANFEGFPIFNKMKNKNRVGVVR